MTLPIAIALGVRMLLVMLFLPFSALDKITNFNGAVAQAQQAVPVRSFAVVMILLGLAVEVAMSAAILAGVGDRAAAFVLAGYCVVTALLWKRFWGQGDFWSDPNGKARVLFWDFLKNLAVAGGFLLITFGLTAGSVDAFFKAPLASTHPYSRGSGQLQ